MYLNCSEIISTEISKKQKRQRYEDNNDGDDIDRMNEQYNVDCEINFSSSQVKPHPWVIKYHDVIENQESKFLNYGDYIWLTNLEKRAHLKGAGFSHTANR